jgi:hypothetical protein
MGRALRSLPAFGPLSAAEARIVAELDHGDFDRLGDGARPAEADDDRVVRAELLRFLLLGGEADLRPHEKGVRVSGAWIRGVLDLEGCRIPRDIGLKDCHFEAVPVLRSAVIDSLFLDGAMLPGLQAERLEARGGVYLRGVEATGEIRLTGARVTGSLECDGASIANPDAVALNADHLVAQSVLLRGAQVRGRVSLIGARLAGDLDAAGLVIERSPAPALNADDSTLRGNVSLRGASVAGGVRLLGARVAGDVDCSTAVLSAPGETALALNRSVVEGAFFLQGPSRIEGALDLRGATLGGIQDDAASWPAKGELALNRCIYAAFLGGPVDAASRLDWLGRQDPARWGDDFWPQPYEQLASVFSEMGHGEDARSVLIAKERLQRRARRARARGPLWRVLLAVKDRLLAITVVYGRQPLLAFAWLAGFWLLGVAIFAQAERAGAMKPNSAVVLRSAEWTMCGLERSRERYMPSSQQVLAGRAEPGQGQLDCFRAQPEAGSYPAFNAWMYSLDTLFPVLEVGQKDFWRPEPARPWGRLAMGYFYLQAVVGWGFSLLAVAGFSGLVKSR